MKRRPFETRNQLWITIPLHSHDKENPLSRHNRYPVATPIHSPIGLPFSKDLLVRECNKDTTFA